MLVGYLLVFLSGKLGAYIQISVFADAVVPDDTPRTSTTAQALNRTEGELWFVIPPDNYLQVSSNPWYLTTATMAQFLYSAALELEEAGSLSITKVSAPFFTYYAPSSSLKSPTVYSSNTTEFSTVIASLKGWGDAYIRRIKYHTPASRNLAEEFNRNDGFAQGAADLTWSYASLLSASFARAVLSGDASYVEKIANLAY